MRPIDYLETLSFVRMAGSDAEHKAAVMIAGWLEKIGYKPKLESFEINTFTPGEGELTPVSPSGEPFYISPVGLSTDCELEGEIIVMDVPEPEWVDKTEFEEKIVITGRGPSKKWIEFLVESKAKAMLMVVDDTRIRAYRKLSQSCAKEFGEKLPIATIGFKHAIRLIRDDVKTVRIRTEHKKFVGVSHNVVAEIPCGNPEEKEKIVIFTAHYDSTPCSPGAQDNAAGTAELLEIANRFAGKKFPRTVRFIFCGAEEMGLLGSKAYTNSHIDELEKIDFVINLDVGGDPFNPVFIRAIGTDELEHFVTGLLKAKGLPATVSQDIYSSDGMPFAKFGVPSLSIARAGVDRRGHSPYDSPDRTCNEALTDIIDYTEKLTETIIESNLLPFPRKISDEMNEKVSKYFVERE